MVCYTSRNKKTELLIHSNINLVDCSRLNREIKTQITK